MSHISAPQHLPISPSQSDKGRSEGLGEASGGEASGGEASGGDASTSITSNPTVSTTPTPAPRPSHLQLHPHPAAEANPAFYIHRFQSRRIAEAAAQSPPRERPEHPLDFFFEPRRRRLPRELVIANVVAVRNQDGPSKYFAVSCLMWL